jgi:hypothetical protein
LKTKNEKKKDCWRFNEIIQNKNKFVIPFVIPSEVYENLGLLVEASGISNIAWINLGQGQIFGTSI